MDADNILLFKALGDPSRLKMLQLILAEGPISVEILCEHLKLVPSTVSHHAKKLLQAQLICSHRKEKTVYYQIESNILNTPLKEIVTAKTAYTDGRSESYNQKVLDTFISCGKLLKIPAQRKKRRIILEQIVQELEKERIYAEKELTAVLTPWHEDYCFLRREMIAEGLLSREKNRYQRL